MSYLIATEQQTSDWRELKKRREIILIAENDDVASSDIMNDCVDGWVEDVERNEMQSERKKRI